MENNFRYALSLAQLLYDVDIKDEDDAIEIGLVAYRKIGNKNTILKKEMMNVDCATGTVELPCGVTVIEAVTYCGSEDWNFTDNTKPNGDYLSYYAENYIESQKAFLDPHYISGKFLKYKRVGNTLYVNRGIGKVTMLYHQEILDEDLLPVINDKEAIAIAEYIAYVYKYKEAIRSKDQGTMAIAKDLKLQWLFHCDAARVPENISQNDMNSILDAVTSHNRKMYGKSYKPTL